ncbi:Apoptosis regulatory protein siva [Plakobranchus ocellatus]|uniref:Apoptosis regulatory protein siva n=1 Tax=Plakobranchus ocellatus TaxID=259542 RepID=A0AAV4CS11_9GAST|nr:Apoptosis regulatory protein siva [Plakobranchus ocellatus]
MPKRNNPFGDHSSLQLKMHVGEKEVDKGVCQQTRMQTVYERTRALLFNGMKSNAEAEMVVDVNYNHTLHDGGLGCGENPHWQNSSLKQLHLNRNCELVNSEGTESIDMETDSYLKANCDGAIPKVPSVFMFDTAASGPCIASPMLPFGLHFGRSSGAFSPINSAASSEALDHEADCSLGPSNQNAFSVLMQGPLRSTCPNNESGSRACHNCRKPVQTRDVIKCQFCEQYICSNCVRQCYGCFQHYCQLCSVVNYDQSSERAICLTCDGR